MVILKIDRKLQTIVIIVVLAGLFGFNIYSYVRNIKLSNRYDSPVHSAVQSERSNLTVFVASKYIQGQEGRSVEIFDIRKGEVIKKVQSSRAIQKQAESFLEGITGMYVKVKAFPDQGFIVRIPLQPPITVQNQWLSNCVEEVFVLFPEKEKPYLLVLDDKSRPLFYTFEGDTETLLQKLNFKPETAE